MCYYIVYNAYGRIVGKYSFLSSIKVLEDGCTVKEFVVCGKK